MKQYCFKDIYWFVNDNNSIVVPFVFNTDRSKIKLLENESIISLELKKDDKYPAWFTERVAAIKIAEYSKIELDRVYESIYDSTSLLFSKLYGMCLDPKNINILNELSKSLQNTNATYERNVVNRFVDKTLVSYNDLKPLIYSMLNLDEQEIINFTHNQTTEF